MSIDWSPTRMVRNCSMILSPPSPVGYAWRTAAMAASMSASIERRSLALDFQSSAIPHIESSLPSGHFMPTSQPRVPARGGSQIIADRLRRESLAR
ncbi:hypothetical protein ACFXG7_18200 [Nocardia tengchongensis]|uniref:hypothetical protein n=1 Tax=Nocardia tengchongensis TaxID=2055889 RepID=UPI00368F5180